MKKILVALFLGAFLLVGCDNTMNTPTSKVEEFLGKYQKLDKKVLTELDDVINKDENMNDDQRKEYKIILEKQYQNLSYKIKNEDIEGDSATVDVEIEVLDYQSSIKKSKEYYQEHQDEFKEEKQEENKNNDDKKDASLKEKAEDLKDDVKDNIEKASSFIDYKIKELKNVTDKTKYDLTFNLTKKDGKWIIDDLSDEDRKKIHGLY